MSRAARWVVALLVLALLGVGIERVVQKRKGRVAAAPAQAASAIAPIELAATDVARASRAELAAGLPVSGGLKAVNSAFVKAKVAAELKQLLVREGDAVKAGQLLGRLDDTEYRLRLRQAEDQAATARAQVDIAQRTLDNNKALVDQGFISKNALDTSVSNAAGARASLQAAQAAADLARKSLADTEIHAPLSGLVSQRLVQPGERVPIDGRMLEIVDLSRLELEAAVAPEDVVAVRIGQRASLQVDGLAAPLSARVVRINPSTQTGTRAVLVYLAVDAEPRLRQGLFANGHIELQRKTALVVPSSAVHFDQAMPYLLAVQGGQVVQRKVTLGTRGEVAMGEMGTEAAVEIVSGIDDGATVLRGSVGALRAGTPVTLAAAAAAAPVPAASR